MKNLILSVAILTSSLSVVAFSNNILPTEIFYISLNEDFAEVELNKLPLIITDAVKKDFVDAKLVKAYMNIGHQYKLELKSEETTKIVFIDKNGFWLKESDIETMERK